MAVMVTRTVLALIDGKVDTPSNRVELTTSLVIRSGTAPPSASAGRGAAGIRPSVRRPAPPGA
jgi:hypothetical protein